MASSGRASCKDVHQLDLGVGALLADLGRAALQRRPHGRLAVAAAGGRADRPGAPQKSPASATTPSATANVRPKRPDRGRPGRSPRAGARPVGGGLLREPGAEREHEVGALDELLHRGLLDRRAGMQRMPARKDALAVVGRDHRRVERSASARTAAAAWRAPPPAQIRGASAASIRPRTRATAAGSGAGAATRVTRAGHGLGDGRHDIGRDLDRGRAGIERHLPERLVDGVDERLRRRRPGVEARHGRERLRLAAALVQVAAAGADEIGGDLRGQVQHRRARGVGLRQRRQRVERPRAGARQVNAGAVARARIADRAEPGRLLVADDDPPDRGADQRVPHRQRVDPGQAEHHRTSWASSAATSAAAPVCTPVFEATVTGRRLRTGRRRSARRGR